MAFQNTTNRVWKKHKYIRKEGNRYIYPEDLKRMQNSRSKDGKLVRTITDVNGNKIRIRGAAATNTIASKSNHYDRASGERFSPSEYRTRMQDGSIDRMRGQVTQEAAKKQGQYSVNMMRQQKAAQQRSVPRQTMTSAPANLRINEQVQKQSAVQKRDPIVPRTATSNTANQNTQRRSKEGKLVRNITDVNGNKVQVRGYAATKTIANKSNHYDKASGERLSSAEYQSRMQNKSNSQKQVSKQTTKNISDSSQNVSTAASQAMQRAGYTGPIKRPQNQHVVAKTNKEETNKTETKNEESSKSDKLAALLGSTDSKKTTSTRSSGSSKSSGGTTKSSSGDSSSSGSTQSTGKSSGSSSSSGSGSSSVGFVRSSSKSSNKNNGGSSKSSQNSGENKSDDGIGSEKVGPVLSAVDKKESKEKKSEKDTMLEELESILDPNMDISKLSDEKISSIVDKLKNVIGKGKSETNSKANTKLKESKHLVSLGLDMLKHFKEQS